MSEQRDNPARREWLLILALTALALMGAGVRYLRDRARPEVNVVEAAAEADFRLDVNEATADELQVLPGIGPGRAAKVVAKREEHGPFQSLEGFAVAAGISDKQAAGMQSLVTLGPEAEDRLTLRHPEFPMDRKSDLSRYVGQQYALLVKRHDKERAVQEVKAILERQPILHSYRLVLDGDSLLLWFKDNPKATREVPLFQYVKAVE